MEAGYLLLALAPGVFWLWFYTRKNDYGPEPRRLLALTFGMGMLAVVPAALIEYLFISDSIQGSDVPLGSVAAALMLVVGPVEEGAKFLAVRMGPYRSRYFEEPMDGLVYGTAASLGFASLENFFYILQYGPGVIVARAALSTLAHLVFGSIWGLALGRSKGKRGGSLLALGGLAAAAAAHGVFDLAAGSGALVGVGIALVALGAVWTMNRFTWARRVSQFQYRRNYPLIECPSCAKPARVTFHACPYCGMALKRGHTTVICGNCSARNRPDAQFCTHCGDRFVG